VTAALVIWEGAAVVVGSAPVGVMKVVFGGEVKITGGEVKVEVVGTGTVEKIVPPFVVKVFSLGTVTSTTVGTLVASVIGTKTVAFVVGGSAVFVIVYADVTKTVEVMLSVITMVDPAETVV